MLSIDIDLLDPTPREAWVTVPVDEEHREAGTVSVKIRELPEQEKEALTLSLALAARSLIDLARTTEEPEGESDTARALRTASISTQYATAYAECSARLRAARRTLIRRCVADHAAGEFTVKATREQAESLGQSIGLSASQIRVLREEGRCLVPYQAEADGVGEATLRLYERAHPALIVSLSRACLRFQEAKTRAPEEIWPRPFAQATEMKQSEVAATVASRKI
jgi:hypothetical protein